MFAEAYCECCKPPPKPVSIDGDEKDTTWDDPQGYGFYDYGDEKHPYDDFPYMYDYVLRSTAASSRDSPMKCVTPAEPAGDFLCVLQSYSGT